MIDEMTVATTAIEGLLRITPKAVTEERGTVREFFRASAYAEHGVPVPDRWAQLNLTRTARGGLRGMHGENADKLIGIASGEVFGAWVDARPESPTRGALVTADLRVGTQMFVPAGVCNGFQAVTDCEYLYCFGDEWRPGMAGVAFNPFDPAVGIAWPLTGDDAIVSAKDAAAPPFAEI